MNRRQPEPGVAPILASVRSMRLRIAVLGAGLLGDSSYLIGAGVASALGGFAFWLLAARLTSPASVGFAAALIAASTLLHLLAEMGLSAAIIRYGPSTLGLDKLVNTATRLAVIVGSAAVAGFLLGLPMWAPRLQGARQSPVLAVAFLFFTVGNLMMSFQDSAMLVKRHPRFIFWRNVACNVPPVLLLATALSLTSTTDVVAGAFMLPNLVVLAYTGLVSVPRAIPGYRFFGRFDGPVLRGTWRYGFLSYLSTVIWTLPAYLLPVMAVSRDSLAAAGVFAVSWSLTNFTYLIPRNVSTALFARLSRAGASTRRAFVLSGAIVLVLGVPALALLWLGGPRLLGLFGNQYADPRLVRTLLVSFFPFAVNALLMSLLRVSRQPRWILIFSIGYALIVVGATLLMSANGIQGLASGWLAGNLLAVLPGGVLALLSQRGGGSHAGDLGRTPLAAWDES